MKTAAFFFAILFFAHHQLHAQNSNSQDGMFQKNVKDFTGYILTVQTDATRNLIGSTLSDFKDIREKCIDCEVLFVCDEKGLRIRDRQWYVENVLKLHLNKDKNVAVMFDDSLFNAVQGQNLMEQMAYMENGILKFSKTLKHFSLSDFEEFRPFVNLTHIADVIIPDNIRPSIVDLIQLDLDSNTVLYLSDLEEKLYRIDLTTGKTIGSYKSKPDDAVDFYCRVIAKNKKACEYAHKNRYRLHDWNRSELYFSDVKSGSEKVVISSMLQVFEQLEEDFLYTNEMGREDTLPAGSLFANGYSVFIELNKDLSWKNFWLVDDEAEEYDYETGIDWGFYPLENGFIIQNVMDDETDGTDFMFSLFEKKNKSTVAFEKNYSPTFPKGYEEKAYENDKSTIIPFEGRYIGFVDVVPAIYDINLKTPLYSLNYSDPNNVCEEYYAQYYEDAVNSKLRYRIFEIGELIDNQLGVLYSYCGEEIIFDILSKDFELNSRIFIGDFIDFDPWFDSVGANITINGDRIIFLTKEDDEFVLKIFRLGS